MAVIAAADDGCGDGRERCFFRTCVCLSVCVCEDGFGSCNSLTIAPVPEGASILPADDARGKCSWHQLAALPGDPVSEGHPMGSVDEALATARHENESLRQLCCLDALAFTAWAAVGVIEVDRVRNECPHDAGAGASPRVEVFQCGVL